MPSITKKLRGRWFKLAMASSVLFSFLILFQNFLPIIATPSLPTVQILSISNQGLIIEGGSPVNIVISRTGGNLNSPLSVNLQFSGLAIRGQDYTLSGGGLTPQSTERIVELPADEQQIQISISALPDSDYEARERIIISLAPGNGYTIQGSPSAFVRISRDIIPPNTFLFIANPMRRFNPNEISYIANHYKYVVLSKVHAARNYIDRDLDAENLKQENPDIKLFAYIAPSVRFWYNTFGRDGLLSPPFNNHWYFKDSQGRDLQYLGNDALPAENIESRHLYVDLSKKSYRNWVRDTIRKWQDESNNAWSGVFFDNSTLINEEDVLRRPLGLRRVFNYEQLNSNGLPTESSADISSEKVRDWNLGLMKLFDEAHRDRSTESPIEVDNGDPFLVAFNGIGNVNFFPNRNLNVLYNSEAEIALNERFCFHTKNSGAGQYQSKAELEEEFRIMKKAAKRGKIIWQKTNTDNWQTTNGQPINWPNDSKKLGRYCYGAFLMAYLPGFHLYKFGSGYFSNPDAPDYDLSKDEIYLNADGINLRLGRPRSNYEIIGETIWRRKFETGMVYVNPSSTQQTFVLTQSATIVIDGVRGQTYTPGSSIILPPHDTAFFVYN